MNKVYKIVTVTIVIALSWFGTVMLIARQRAAPSSGQVRTPVSNPSGDVKTSTQSVPGAVAGRAAAIDPGIVQPQKAIGIRKGIDQLEVTFADDNLIVAGKAIIEESSAAVQHVWRLTLLDSKGDPITQSLYDNQTFRVQPGFVSEPTFAEVTQHLPGTAYIQLSLFAFPEGMDVKAARDDKESKHYLAARKVVKIESR